MLSRIPAEALQLHLQHFSSIKNIFDLALLGAEEDEEWNGSCLDDIWNFLREAAEFLTRLLFN